MYNYALISVFNKCCITEIAKQLVQKSVKIISTGGTAYLLRQHGFDVKEVSSITNFPEIMSGRVKTLHPKIFGGILARRNKREDMEELHEIGGIPIDIVIVNLYPFEEMADKNISENKLIEYIDIGGVALIRAAAKNYHSVVVITNVDDYYIIEDYIAKGKKVPLQLRKNLAIKAFETTAKYDNIIAQTLKSR